MFLAYQMAARFLTASHTMTTRWGFVRDKSSRVPSLPEASTPPVVHRSGVPLLGGCQRRADFKNMTVLDKKPPAEPAEIAGSAFLISGYGHPRFAAVPTVPRQGLAVRPSQPIAPEDRRAAPAGAGANATIGDQMASGSDVLRDQRPEKESRRSNRDRRETRGRSSWRPAPSLRRHETPAAQPLILAIEAKWRNV